MTPLDIIGPAFVEMAHRIVWCVAATTDRRGQPRTRVVHPIWELDGGQLTGWFATWPQSPKATHLDANPGISLTYWAPEQDTCTVDCTATWEDEQGRRTAWERFTDAPAPVGYDPSVIPDWDSPASPAFGVVRLAPHRLRLMPGTVMTQGTGEVLTWHAGATAAQDAP